jgi:hypothetical protein
MTAALAYGMCVSTADTRPYPCMSGAARRVPAVPSRPAQQYVDAEQVGASKVVLDVYRYDPVAQTASRSMLLAGDTSACTPGQTRQHHDRPHPGDTRHRTIWQQGVLTRR